MSTISLFGTVYNTAPKGNVPLEAYLTEIRDGRYEDAIYELRNEKNEKTYKRLKANLDRVTFSGTFQVRENAGLLEHSGYIAIDIDDLEEPEVVKEMLMTDKYVYAAFVSSSGKGLTVLFRINPLRHRESYLGLSQYLLKTYNIMCDPQSIAVSKPFGVTYDPNLYVSDTQVPLFLQYVKETRVEKIVNFAFADEDFNEILKQITQRGINLCDDYDRWVKIGFAFADKFGERGRDYYHVVSSISEKYSKPRTDKQYDYSIKRTGVLKLATISTFYFYCKEAGVKIFSDKTQRIRKIVVNSKTAGLGKKQIFEVLEKEGLESTEETISEMFDNSASQGDGDSILDQLELYMSANYKLERNTVSRFIEKIGGEQLEQRDLNTMFIAAKKVLNNLTYELFERLVMSDYVQGYHPVRRFLTQFNEGYKEDLKFKSPLIDRLSSSIINDTPEFTNYFLKKWLVSSISCAFGLHSPLMFVLSGERQGTGKTEFFRRLLPKEMQKYYAESKLDAGKDDEILMTQKWFIMDDEMSGKSKKEEQRLKELTSKQTFDLREPYGRINVSLHRLACLCATTNTKNILRDTENRRIIPVNVSDINHKVYNSIDKIDLFRETYCLWKSGFDWTVLKEDITYLKTHEFEFEAVSIEKELLLKYYTNENADEMLTSSEIKVEMEYLTNQKMSIENIGKQLTKNGFINKAVKEYNSTKKKWLVKKIGRGENYVRTISVPPDTF